MARSLLILPALLTILLVGSPLTGRAQEPDRLRVKAWITPPAEGNPAHLVIEATVEPNWHTYSITQPKPGPNGGALPTQIRLQDPQPFKTPLQTADFRAAPSPQSHFDNSFKANVEEHEGTVTWSAPVEFAQGVDPGNVTVEGSVYAQLCESSGRCLLPKNYQFTARLDAAAPAPPSPPSLFAPNFFAAGPNGQGLWRLAIFAVLGAMLSWVMPCVYPMLPVTISFFGKVAEKKHVNRVGVAMSYGLGLAGTFVAIGLIVGLLSLGATSAAQRADLSTLGNTIATNPWLNLAIGLLFVAFALSMFGLFTIRMPSWLINRADRAGRSSKSAHAGAVLLGVTFSLASFTCTVPVVGYLLVDAASGTGQGFMRCLLGMLVYGGVFAAPFVLLSMFPGVLHKLPKAGNWMEVVKVAFGFLELAVALKFLWVPDLEWGLGLLTRPIVLWLFVAIALATVCFFLGIVTFGHGVPFRPLKVGIGRWIAAAGTLVLLTPIAMSLASAPSYQADGLPIPVVVALETVLPPPPANDELARAEGWFVDDYEGALQEARRSDKPLFIDFTGVNCGNCRAMERTVFQEETIKPLFDQMVRVRLYVDRQEEKHASFARLLSTRYGLSSQPFYVVLDPRDEATMSADGGAMLTGEFENLLQQGLRNFQPRRQTASR